MKNFQRVYTIIIYIISIVFIVSALFKLLSTNNFEILLIKLSIADWHSAALLTRILISLEFILGALLLFQIYTKQILQIIFYTLIAFTVYLLYINFFLQYDENCGCFGSIVKMNPIESIIKNVILLFSTKLVLLKYNFTKKSSLKDTLIGATTIIGILLVVFIVNPIHLSDSKENYEIKPHQKITDVELQHVTFSNGETINLLQGKKMICFLSLKCKVCKYTASKLSVLEKRYNNQLPIYIIFLKAEKNNQTLLQQFFKETDASMIPYSLFDERTFLKVSDANIPFLMILDNGEIKDLSNYNDFYPEKVIELIHN